MHNSEEIEKLKENNNNFGLNEEKSSENKNNNNILISIYIFFISTIILFFLIIINLKLNTYNNFQSQFINHKLDYNITPIDPNGTKRKIYVKYMDFWPAFNINKFDIDHILKERYEVIQSDTPDYIFYSDFGRRNVGIENRIDCIKIFISIENKSPNFLSCDYAIGLHYIDKGDRYCRKPTDTSKLSQMQSLYNYSKVNNITIKNKKFCAWVVSNGGAYTRNQFYKKLSEYKTIDSGGRFKNNIGYIVKNKKEFLKGYKFSICFENSKKLGYISEKLFDAFQAGTIPIYFGDDSVKKLINSKSYIHVNDINDFNKKIDLIKKRDQDDDLYESMIKEKIVINDSYFEPELKKYKNFIYHIIEQDKQKAKRFKRKNETE